MLGLNHIIVGVCLLLSPLMLMMASDIGEYSVVCIVAGMMLMYAIMFIVRSMTTWYDEYKACYEVHNVQK